MPTPRFTPQVRSIQPEPRPAEQDGQTITTEIVEIGAGLTGYLIRGFATPTRAGLILVEGDVVSVLWKHSKPFMILNLQSLKGPGTDEPFASGPVVEELFIIGDDGKKEVYFRNDKQVTNLDLHKVLGEDPVDVRWGQDMNNFIVVTGKPTAQDLIDRDAHPKQFLRVVKKYHIFALTSTVVRKHGLGGKKPTPKRKRIVEPYADQTLLYKMQTTLDHLIQDDVLNVRNEWTLTATPSGGPADAALLTHLDNIVVTPVGGPGFSRIDVTNEHKLDEILNGLNTDNRLYYGEVDDFGCDLQGVFFLSVRTKFWRVAEPVEGAVENDFSVPDFTPSLAITPCEASVSFNPGVNTEAFTAFNEGEPPGQRSQGEAQYFVVKFGLPAPTVLWSSMPAEILMSNSSREASAFGYFTTFEKYVGTTFENPFEPPFTPQTDHTVDAATQNGCLANPYVLPSIYSLDHFPNGFPFVEEVTDRFPNGFEARRMTLIDKDRLPFVDSNPVMESTEAPSVTQQFAKAFQTFDAPDHNIAPGHPANYAQTWEALGSAVLSTNPGTGERIFGISRIDWVHRTFFPTPTWSYRIRLVRVLDAGHPKPLPALKPVIAVVVDRLQCTNPTGLGTFEKQLGFFVFDTKGNMLTLMPFTDTGTGDVPDEFAGTKKLDAGVEIAILSGNRSHVLWTLSTAAERTGNVRHIKLSSLATATGETRAVGDNWPEFEPHRFKILNLDAALYEAREKTVLGARARKFTDAWDFKTKKPTLNQSAAGYPKPILPGAGMLKDLPPDITADPDPVGQYHAVNDRAILGSKWDVKDNAIPLV